jgi:HSP20 family protein
VGTEVALLNLTSIAKTNIGSIPEALMAHRGSLTGPVFGLRREIDRLFEDAFGGDSRRGGWAPAVDVREDAKEIVLEVELPGIKPTDVEVTAENGVLTIRGEKHGTGTDGGEGRYHVLERSYGSFARSFHLPSAADEHRIDAEFVDGLLTVRIPKATHAPPRRIEIRNNATKAAPER